MCIQIFKRKKKERERNILKLTEMKCFAFYFKSVLNIEAFEKKKKYTGHSLLLIFFFFSFLFSFCQCQSKKSDNNIGPLASIIYIFIYFCNKLIIAPNFFQGVCCFFWNTNIFGWHWCIIVCLIITTFFDKSFNFLF